MLRIDPIFCDDVIFFVVEPGFKRRAALGRSLPRLGEPLRKTECDERIMGAPAQKIESPEAEPRKAGRLIPFTQRSRERQRVVQGKSVSVRVEPGVRRNL